MKYGLFLVGALLQGSCSQESPQPRRTLSPPGAIELKSEQHMRDFLASGRFSSIGNMQEWWDFHEDGTFQAQLKGEKLFGNWIATRTDLHLTKLNAVSEGGLMVEVPDRQLELDWQDGKLNINIEDQQYRKYRLDINGN